MSITQSTSEKFVESGQFYTTEQFLEMDFDQKVELVEGALVFMGWNNLIHTGVIAWLVWQLTGWAEESGWGLVFGSDSGVRTKQNPDTTRGADIACVSHENYGQISKNGKVFERGPELLIEVVSPSNSWEDIQDKIIEYFNVGTNEVWVVSPKHASVTLYESPKQSTTYSAAEAESVVSNQLPGFSLSLVKLAERIELISGNEDA